MNMIMVPSQVIGSHLKHCNSFNRAGLVTAQIPVTQLPNPLIRERKRP